MIHKIDNNVFRGCFEFNVYTKVNRAVWEILTLMFIVISDSSMCLI